MGKKSVDDVLSQIHQEEAAAQSVEDVELVEDCSAESLKLFILSPRIKTKEEALAKANVDLDQWEPSKISIKSYEVGMKIEGTNARGHKFTRGAAVVPLFGISIELKKRIGLSVPEFRASLLKDLEKRAPVYRKVAYPSKPRRARVMAELSITDQHFGKLSWSRETGSDYDLKIAEKTYINAAVDLIAHAAPYRPVEFLYIVGSDLLHVDNGGNTTTKGTPQHVDGRWQKSYQVAQRSLIRAIELMRQHAPVRVMVIPGNHDEEKAFCLGESLACRFHNDDCVTVDNEPTKRKFHVFGETLLGWEHGHNLKSNGGAKDLPFNMMAEVPRLYAATTWHEIHTGHLHSERETVWTRVHTVGDVIHRVLPSLSKNDTWHKDNRYRSPQAAEVHLYDYDSGRLGYMSVRPRMK